MRETELLTADAIKALKDELEELKTTRWEEVQEKLKAARALGDLAENAEYDAAMYEREEMIVRIEEIERILESQENAAE